MRDSMGAVAVSAASSTQNNLGFAYAPGDLIASKYLLEELIGEGGMGAVFRARNTSLDMLVAIKLMRADLNRELLAGRLVQEARAAAKLTHPGIVRVFDVGQTALGDPFIVMELLEGEPLSVLMDRERRLTPIHAVQLLLPIADALSAAHAKGLVHRDVKPDNVLLIVSEEGIVQPKLLDFGIVKLAQPDGGNAPSDAGSVVGSPDYMSPEQARGLAEVDARSDLWSFSVVLYEAIAGVTPFQSSNYDSLLRMIVQQQPPTLLELGAASQALSLIVARGLSKDPLARYASLTEMGKALAAWLAEQGVSEDASGVSLEAKWLARATDPLGLGRASWPPPPRSEQVSGVHNLSLILANATTVHTPELTLAPSLLAPLPVSPPEPEPEPRPASHRLWLVVLAASLLTLPVAWLAVARVRSQPQRVQATFVSSQSATTGVDEARPPVAIASTVRPVENASQQPKSESSRRSPTPPKAAPPAAARIKEERTSDLLAPNPF